MQERRENGGERAEKNNHFMKKKSGGKWKKEREKKESNAVILFCEHSQGRLCREKRHHSCSIAAASPIRRYNNKLRRFNLQS